jgi:hypothetical protein
MNSSNLKCAVTVLILGASVAQAQVTKDQLDAAGAALQAPRTFFSKLTPQQQKRLSGAARSFFHRANNWPDLESQILAAQDSPLSSQPGQDEPAPAAAQVNVSNPATDFLYGPSSGFTQSTTSTAWCGQNVVIGFNDTGSWYESLLAFPNSNRYSLVGFARSTDQGVSYTDKGFLPSALPPANSYTELEGDPVVVCASASTFYFSSLSYGYNYSSGTNFTAVSVSKSTNGGSSFGAPVIAVSKDALTHSLDRQWIAVNPSNPQQIAVTYTDNDNSYTLCGSLVFRTGIELVTSSDGGNTWSNPKVIYTACEGSSTYQYVVGAQVAFSPSGALYVSYELYSSGSANVGWQIEFVKAANLGSAFGAPVTVAKPRPPGNGPLQGGWDLSGDLQGMAVDRSGKATNGNIYIVYHDATDFGKVFHNIGYYGYSDVMIAKSTNGGATWSAPVEVNTNPEPPPSGLGVDSFMPVVAVDNTSGKVGVCWYDRRNDPLNYAVDRYCGDSVDAGASFTNVRMTASSFSPIHGTDFLVYPGYVGDYDTLASDFLKSTSGFIGAFLVVGGTGGATLVPNSDVKAQTFQ